MRIGKHFTAGEVLRSGWAAEHGHMQYLTREWQTNATLWAELIGDPVREAAGKPYHVTSWGRDAVVNAGVGGDDDSHHRTAAAVDGWVEGMSTWQLAALHLRVAGDHITELICYPEERGGHGRRVHTAVRLPGDVRRMRVLVVETRDGARRYWAEDEAYILART